MSVVMIILGSLVTTLLAIGIVSGVVFSVIAVIRLLTGRGTFNGKTVGAGKRILLSLVCILNICSLLIGGFFGVHTYQIHKDEIWTAIEQQSSQDDILPNFMKGNNEMMNETILNDVTNVAGNISPLTVILLLLITTVGAVLMIVLCTGGLKAVKKLWKRLFGKKD